MEKTSSGVTDFEKFIPSAIYHMSEVDYFIATNIGFYKTQDYFTQDFYEKIMQSLYRKIGFYES
jgi:hypothetical protein